MALLRLYKNFLEITMIIDYNPYLNDIFAKNNLIVNGEF